MSKKVSEIQKKAILNYFIDGYNIDQISNKFKFSSQTIVRQLKNLLGNEEFLRIKKLEKNSGGKIEKDSPETLSSFNYDDNLEQVLSYEDSFKENQNIKDEFFEIVPITSGIDLEKQKDISSRPIDKFDLPKTVFMIIDNKNELDPKLLRQYPEWEFLPDEDLDRETLEIFSEQRLAKAKCGKSQKLIKIPNAKVFLIASKFLKSRGISRIIYEKVLLSL